jgi:hypothetical protein
MCYEEAQQVARELANDVEVKGDGPILLAISHPYCCKSEDAFVRMVPHLRRRFATRIRLPDIFSPDAPAMRAQLDPGCRPGADPGGLPLGPAP